MARVIFNHVEGTARCEAHGDTYCDHMERLARRFDLMTHLVEKRVQRGLSAAPQIKAGMADVVGEPRSILAGYAERPLAAGADESPIVY